MTTTHLLKRAVLGKQPEVTITPQEYEDAKRCYRQVYEAFEIELAFDFMVTNYVEIEKFIAEHLVLDMTGQTRSEDAFRLQQWGFVRALNNWLASISFWRDLTRSRVIAICGRGQVLKAFDSKIAKLQDVEFVTAFLFHLRNYSQHGGFPLTDSSIGGSWNKQRTALTISAHYKLNYNRIRPYFEQGGRGSKAREAFGAKVEAYGMGKPFDLKPVIRQSLGHFGQFMDEVRALMEKNVNANEALILNFVERYSSAYPGSSIIGLSAMPVGANGIVKNKADVIPVRDEFILRAREMRKKNNGKTLALMEKRIISNS